MELKRINGPITNANLIKLNLQMTEKLTTKTTLVKQTIMQPKQSQKTKVEICVKTVTSQSTPKTKQSSQAITKQTHK